jgi:hypothetical protein
MLPDSEPWVDAMDYARDRVRNGYVAAADAKAGGQHPTAMPRPMPVHGGGRLTRRRAPAVRLGLSPMKSHA